MADAKQRWDEVGDRFTDITRKMKERYDANVAFGDDEKAKMNAALRQLGDALEAGFTAIGNSLRDPGIRDDVKRAGSSVADAIAATFHDLADAIRRS